jgi:hypothetical protein
VNHSVLIPKWHFVLPPRRKGTKLNKEIMLKS